MSFHHDTESEADGDYQDRYDKAYRKYSHPSNFDEYFIKEAVSLAWEKDSNDLHELAKKELDFLKKVYKAGGGE